MPETAPLIYWDVDTQNDFMLPDGKLYIQGAETILPNLARLTRRARETGRVVVGSVDWHQPDDPELSDDPDFKETFPPHCLAGTNGAEKVEATAPLNPLWIPNDPQEPSAFQDAVRAHTANGGEAYLQKSRFDVFTNPNAAALLDALNPARILLYGVALDVCDAHAMEGLLKRGGIQIYLALDATRAIDPDEGERLVENWRRRGVQIVSTDEAASGALDGA